MVVEHGHDRFLKENRDQKNDFHKGYNRHERLATTGWLSEVGVY